MIPDSIHRQISESLGQDIESENRVSGGSINQAAKITLLDGRACFLKWNTSADPDMFVKEEKGLQLLKSADTSLRVPKVFATGETENGAGFLLQEFIRKGHSTPNSASNFGQSLATLHQHHEEKYGLDHDNYIGKLPQSNSWHETGSAFL